MEVNLVIFKILIDHWRIVEELLLYHYRPCTQTCMRIFFFCRVEKNIYCRVKKRSLIRTLVIKKNDEKKGKIKRIFRAHCPKCFKKEMAWQSHKDKRKRKREKEQLVARTTLMITEKGFRLWIGFQVRAAYFISFYIWFFEKIIFKKITNYIFSIIKMLT